MGGRGGSAGFAGGRNTGEAGLRGTGTNISGSYAQYLGVAANDMQTQAKTARTVFQRLDKGLDNEDETYTKLQTLRGEITGTSRWVGNALIGVNRDSALFSNLRATEKRLDRLRSTIFKLDEGSNINKVRTVAAKAWHEMDAIAAKYEKFR